MPKIELAALLALAVKAIVPQLPELSDAELAELRALEENQANPRESLLHAIKAAQEGRANDPATAAADGNGAAAGGKPAAAPTRPAWKEPDYLGPLTGDQAAWRNRHLKPVTGASSKAK